MSPVPNLIHGGLALRDVAKVTKPTEPNGLVLEAWAEGYMVGSLIIMSCITLANMRKGVLLHKLILTELVFGYWQGFFILFNPPVYAWWLSVAAIFLNTSWVLHNVIAWMKLRPFLSQFWSRVFIGTVMLSIPYWIVEIYANFTYFHNINDVFLKTRPWEALCRSVKLDPMSEAMLIWFARDPWWIAAAVILFYNIKTKYDLGVLHIARISPRFAVMLGAMLLSIAFIILDVLSVTSALRSVLPVGINPFWKLSFVFKCLTDSVVLDDFKTALDRLRAFKLSRLGSFAMDTSDSRMREHHDIVQTSNNWTEPPDGSRPVPINKLPSIPSPEMSSLKGGSIDAKAENIENVEDKKYAGIARSASRDRDIEENGIDGLDIVSDGGESHTHVPNLSNNLWPSPCQGPNTSSSDVDVEYAMAVREMIHDASRPRIGRESDNGRVM